MILVIIRIILDILLADFAITVGLVVLYAGLLVLLLTGNLSLAFSILCF